MARSAFARHASDAENRLTRSVAGSIVTTFTNDLYGRRTARITPSGTTTYTWDPSGHLSSVTSADTTVTYAYGITGMREQKTIETTAGTTQTKSVWDGSALAAEQDSDGTVYRYLWGPDRTPLSVAVEYSTGATETFSYHTDALGSVVAMTDESGSVVARYAYSPYGACTVVSAADPIATRNPLRYRAYYADAETGMFYLPARYYDPATYRFLSQDPAAPSAGDPLSLNAYAYCLGDPVGASDPSGAVSDIEAESWSHYYRITGGNRSYSQAASYRLRHNQNYRRWLGQKAYAAQARAIYAASARRDSFARRLDGADSSGYPPFLSPSERFGCAVGGLISYTGGGAVSGAAAVIMKDGAKNVAAGLAGEVETAGGSNLVVAGGLVEMAGGAATWLAGQTIRGSGQDMMEMAVSGRKGSLMAERVADDVSVGLWGDAAIEYLPSYLRGAFQ
ncbi:MAG: RHS repeat-associated core domain-containing protein [Coriobacteriia bacterium]